MGGFLLPWPLWQLLVPGRRFNSQLCSCFSFLNCTSYCTLIFDSWAFYHLHSKYQLQLKSRSGLFSWEVSEEPLGISLCLFTHKSTSVAFMLLVLMGKCWFRRRSASLGTSGHATTEGTLRKCLCDPLYFTQTLKKEHKT